MNITSFILGHKVKAIADSAWGIASVVSVPCLAALAGWWHFGPGGSNAILKPAHTVAVHTQTNVPTPVESGISIDVGDRRLVYTMTLIDSAGRAAYTYPQIMQAEGAPRPDLGNMTIVVPHSVPSGDYQLFVDVAYEVNPLKANKLRVQLAKITVDGE